VSPATLNLMLGLVVGLVNGMLLAAMVFVLADGRPETQSSTPSSSSGDS
jgi:hypothetical protein